MNKVKNIVEKNKQFLLLPFQKLSHAQAFESVCIWERVSYHSGQFTLHVPCFSWLSGTSTLHNILPKQRTPFPHDTFTSLVEEGISQSAKRNNRLAGI